MDPQTLNAMGLETRRKRAKERLLKVACLQEKGLSGPKIAETLGEKLRTIYSDFAKLKRMKIAKSEKKGGAMNTARL